MRYLSVSEVLRVHQRAIQVAGGSDAIRDLALIESAIENAKATFDGIELYPDVIAKTAATAYSLVCNHPFVDGNKRAGYICLRLMIELNGMELVATQQEKEDIIMNVADGTASRED